MCFRTPSALRNNEQCGYVDWDFFVTSPKVESLGQNLNPFLLFLMFLTSVFIYLFIFRSQIPIRSISMLQVHPYLCALYWCILETLLFHDPILCLNKALLPASHPLLSYQQSLRGCGRDPSRLGTLLGSVLSEVRVF